MFGLIAPCVNDRKSIYSVKTAPLQTPFADTPTCKYRQRKLIASFHLLTCSLNILCKCSIKHSITQLYKRPSIKYDLFS